MPPGFKGNFGVPKTKGVAEFNRFRTPLPLSYTIPFVPYDWSRQAQVVPSRRVENQTQNLSLTLLSTAAKYLFRDPTVTNVRFIIPRRTYEVDQNLLLTLLPTTLKPLTGTNLDWMRQQQVQVRAWEATQNRLILPTTLAPFSNKQIAVERAPFTPQRLAESPYQNILLTYRGQMPFFPMEEGLTRPSLIARRYTDDPAQNLSLTLLPLNPAYLFRTPTVANVRAIIPRRTYETDQNLSLTLLPTTMRPFVPQKASDDRAPFVSVRQYENTQNLSLTLLSPVSVVPFAPTDWAQLRGVIPRQSEQTQNLSLTLLPTTMRPFVPQQSSNDRSPMICVRQYENVQNLSLTLLPSGGAPPVVSVKPKRHLPMMGVGR